MKQKVASSIPDVGEVVRIHSYRVDTFYGHTEFVRTEAYVSILRRRHDEDGTWRFHAQLRLGHLHPGKGNKVQLLLEDFDEPQHQQARISLNAEQAATSADFIRKMKGTADDWQGHLLELFNVQQVDFVRKNKDGTYEGVDGPKHATHSLVPANWNDEIANLQKTKKERNIVRNAPDGWATSVCAVPLRRRHTMKGTAIHATRRLPKPKARPVYHAQGTVESKRIVLAWMVEAMRARIHKRFVQKASSEQCDLVYRNLLQEHHRICNK